MSQEKNVLSSDPGPGSYDPKKGRKGNGLLGDAPKAMLMGGPKAAIVNKVDPTKGAFLYYSNQEDDLPGPGQYTNTAAIGNQNSQTRKCAPAYSWGKPPAKRESRSAGNKTNPGPGAYDKDESKEQKAMRKTAPAFSFGKGTRDPMAVKSYISKQHCQDQLGNASPGPLYTPAVTKTGDGLVGTTTVAGKFDRASRATIDAGSKNTPAPNAYRTDAIDSMSAPRILSNHGGAAGTRFSRDDRACNKQREPVYMSRLHETDLKGRFSTWADPLEPRKPGKDGRKVGFGHGNRFNKTDTGEGKPGPSDYSTDKHGGVGKQVVSRHRNQNGFSFGSAERSDLSTGKGVPGPKYNSTVLRDGSTLMSDCATTVFGQSSRSDIAGVSKLAPGPGAYDPVQNEVHGKHNTAPAYSFGFNERIVDTPQAKPFLGGLFQSEYFGSESLGPCAYKTTPGIGLTKSSVHKTAVSSSIQARRNHINATSNNNVPTAEQVAYVPGPGAYDLSEMSRSSHNSKLNQNPSWTFSTIGRNDSKIRYISKQHSQDVVGQASPGPGMYDIKSQFDQKSFQSASKFSFGKSKRGS